MLQALFVACSSKTPPDSKIIELLFSADEKKNPDVLFKKVGNLDDDPELESFSLVRNGTEEVLGIFKKQKGEWYLLGKFSFSLLNIGPLHYDVSKSSWLPGESDSQKKEAGFIVKRILMDELPGDRFNSLFLEVLSEEPPLGLFSVPYVIRKGHKILDGLMTLKDHEFLIKSKRIDFEYNKTEKILRSFHLTEIMRKILFLTAGRWSPILQELRCLLFFLWRLQKSGKKEFPEKWFFGLKTEALIRLLHIFRFRFQTEER
ncbi:hypothetical protein LEP1GSC148_2802 [Leptospira interrogans serovar Canicola str. LT1962]|uniref:Uncharacterized protein n=1 Tax=Leptospira interrogans serovar Lora str. TE 1992 TaxID=1193028 RepID=M3F1S7_LEPIR|nr:hypothetical protein LEP1GSC067_1726 [Leptospira interrogans serovar Lora str. TE 1992]EMF72032.1 hypothetical protein LEP1GSC148_2802 [Leptospira interrogans serovar Canicola str. LT1962]